MLWLGRRRHRTEQFVWFVSDKSERKETAVNSTEERKKKSNSPPTDAQGNQLAAMVGAVVWVRNSDGVKGRKCVRVASIRPP